MNCKIKILIFSFGCLCFIACKKDTIEEPTASQTTTTTTTTTTNTNTGQGSNNNLTQIAEIVVTPDYGTFITTIHKTLTYSAKAYNRYGNELTADFEWSIENDSIGSVDSLGNILGLSQGETVVRASANGVQSNPSELFIVEDCIQLNPPPVPEPAILGVPPYILLNVGATYELTDYIESKRCRVPMSAFKCSADVSIAGLSTATSGSGNTIITGMSTGRTIVTLSFQYRRKYIVVEVIP